MPGGEALRSLAIVGDGATADVLEGAGISTLADVWALDMEDDSVITRLLASATALAENPSRAGVHWDNILSRAYNRLILIHNVGRVEPDVPCDMRCAISHQWPEDPVRTPSGQMYDRIHITRWIRAAGTDPFTRSPLSVSDLVDVDTHLRAAIRAHRNLFAVGEIPRRM